MMPRVALLLIFTYVSASAEISNNNCSSYTGDGEIGWTWNSLKITRCDIANTISSIPDMEADTQVLLISSQPITSLKQNQFISNGQLQVIRIGSSYISEVECHAFQNLTNLAALSLYYNLISSLPTDIFKDTPNIEEIYLAYNKLHTLQRYLFSNLRRLRVVHLYGNEISSIEENTFINVPRLHELSLSKNKLKSLNLNIMSNPKLVSVNYLDLVSNPWHCDMLLCDLMSVYLNTISLWNSTNDKLICESPTEAVGKRWVDAVLMCNSSNATVPRPCGCHRN